MVLKPKPISVPSLIEAWRTLNSSPAVVSLFITAGASQGLDGEQVKQGLAGILRFAGSLKALDGGLKLWASIVSGRVQASFLHLSPGTIQINGLN